MDRTLPSSTADKVAAALLLTLIGGYVDAVGWISLTQVFTANMSGNSIHLGMGLTNLEMLTLRRFGCALFFYVFGLLLTRIALQAATRMGVKRIASLTLGAEALLLLSYAAASPAMHSGQILDQSSPLYFGLVATLAFAMGVQVGTLTHIGPLTVYTTFVTGCLTMFSESLARAIFWIYDSLREGKTLSDTCRGLPLCDDASASLLLLTVWLCYVGGAALGTFVKRDWELHALYLPVVALALLILLDRIRPISSYEEERQAQGLSPT